MNIIYSLIWRYSNFVHLLYKLALPWIAKHPIIQNRQIPVAVYYLSCEHDLPEQVASIRSFIHYVGLPEKIIVVSDGTYTLRSRQLLHRIHSCINVVEWKDVVKNDLPLYVHSYAKYDFLGKKLAILMSISINKSIIYCDSDVLFFPAAREIVALIESKEENPRYLLDYTSAFDERLLLSESEKFNPANAGFILFKKPLDWKTAVSRLENFKGPYAFHTEQTIVHLALQKSQGLSLPRNKFILRIDDQFIYKDIYASKDIVLRHYVSPVRYKFWLNVHI